MEVSAAERIRTWIAEHGSKCVSTPEFLNGLIDELNRHALQILRSVINIRTLHPEVGAITYQWYDKDTNMALPMHLILRQQKFEFGKSRVFMNIVRRTVVETDAYSNSPFYEVRFGMSRVSTRLPAPEDMPQYSIYSDLNAIGATGYYARELQFTDGERNVITFASTKPDGFDDEDLRLLDEVAMLIAPYIEIFAQRLLMQTLLEIYLGEKTGQEVLQGRIQRGDIRKLDSVIWFSDLRDFTKLTAEEAGGVVESLNQYFEAVAEPIREHGGEILKFIGDAILAIFPVQVDARSGAEAALRAAYDAGDRLAELNARRASSGAAALQHGIGLHTGVVKYGNIGSRDRLDFTVIGNAVNLASRIEGLCGASGEAILLSAELARSLPGYTRLVGAFQVKGVAGETQAFAPTARPD
ncbi:MAG: adenylate/guanylate cyclase domain-containing protein [bacterium]|nr:adenylate/guanylate cyclase domain-containing protein [bacterium]